MTPWMDVVISAAQLLPLFQIIPDPETTTDDQLSDSEDEHTNAASRPTTAGARTKRKVPEEMPNGQFASISYVRVYANCRIKRIWLVYSIVLGYQVAQLSRKLELMAQSAEGERTFDGLGSAARRDFALTAAAPPEGQEER